MQMKQRRGATVFSDPFRVMQRPELTNGTKVDGGGARAGWCVVRKKNKARRKRGGMKGESMVLFIGLEGQTTGARIEEAEKWISDGVGASIFGGTVKKEIY